MPEQPRPKDTRAELGETRKQTDSSYIALMNKMEESVPQNGEFFVKFGKIKRGTDPVWEEDLRALILKEGRASKAEGKIDRIVLTRRGPKIISMDKGDILKPMNDERDGFMIGTNLIVCGSATYQPQEITSSGDQEFINQAISDSIKAAKENSAATKDRVALQAEQAKLAQAKQLLRSFDQFAQPPSSSTPGQTT